MRRLHRHISQAPFCWVVDGWLPFHLLPPRAVCAQLTAYRAGVFGMQPSLMHVQSLSAWPNTYAALRVKVWMTAQLWERCLAHTNMCIVTPALTVPQPVRFRHAPAIRRCPAHARTHAPQWWDSGRDG